MKRFIFSALVLLISGTAMAETSTIICEDSTQTPTYDAAHGYKKYYKYSGTDYQIASSKLNEEIRGEGKVSAPSIAVKDSGSVTVICVTVTK